MNERGATREARPAAAPLRAHGRVLDRDAARAKQTGQLLSSIAGALGLRVDTLRVHVDDEAAARTRARGARGLATGGSIWLDPGRYDPGRADGRALLAHEAAHVAQRAETRLRPDRRRPSLFDAEREAAAVAAAVREGRSFAPVEATLPLGVVSADNGATAAAEEATTAPPAEPAAPPRDPLADYREWRSELDTLAPEVTQIYARQLQTMHDKLGGLWVSDGDVDRVMETLEPLPAADAAALVRALDHRHRTRLVDNVSGSHKRNFRREVLASYAGLTPEEVRRFGRDLFDDLTPVALTPQEHFLAVVVLLDLTGEDRRRLMRDDNSRRAEAFTALLTGRAPDTAAELRAARARTSALVQRRAAEAALSQDPAFQRRLRSLQERLRNPSQADALAALDELGAMRPTAAAAVTPREASEAAQRQTDPPPAAVPSPDAFAVAADGLEQRGMIERLIRRLPRRDQLTQERRDTFLALLQHRPVDANERLVVALLDTGFFTFHWWVSQSEAELAWEIVRALPLDARERFLRRDDGEWLQRLESNLPAGLRNDPEFAGLAVRRDASGNLVDAAALHAAQLRGGGSQLVTTILQKLDRRTPEANAEALADIFAIRPPELREAVVGRLDTLRRIDDLVENLPNTVLFSEDRRQQLQALMAARDVAHLLRHIHRLLSTNLLDWAVTSREAFIAFEMFRALPVPERQRLGQLEFIIGELSTSMRASSGLHVLDGSSAAAQLEAVRTRLRDERLWVAEHAAELRSLVGIATALGDRQWVFEQSRIRGAWNIEGLRPMVARFRLYDERPPGRRRYQEEAVAEAGFWDDIGFFRVLKIVGGALYIVAREGFSGRLYINLGRGEAGLRRFALGDAADLLGGDVGGARFRDPHASSDAAERASAAARQGGAQQTVSTNELTLRYNWSANTVDLDLPALELDSIGRVGPDWSFHTGRVSVRGIRIHAEFEQDEPSRAARASLNVADVELDDVLAGTAQTLRSAARVHLSGLGVAEAADLEPPGPASSTHLPIPGLGALIEVAGMLLRRAGGSTVPREISFELANFEVQGLSIGADQQIASLSIADIRVTWGGTRVRYLRALVAALERRIAATTDPSALARQRAQLEAARTELTEIEPNEARLEELVRRARQPNAVLSADEQAELQRLQAAGRGGIVVDTGAITLRGLSGTIAAAEVTVDRLRGQGSSDALTAGLFTDDALLRRFAESGPPRAPGAGAGDRSDFELEAGRVTATDIVIERAIPETRTLRDERDDLLRDRHGLVAAHQEALLGRLDARTELLDRLIRDRSRLDELEALTEPSVDEIRERRDLHTRLARTFGVTVERAELRGVTVGGNLESGRVTIGAAGVEVTGVASDAYAVRRITGENVRGSAVLLPGISGVTGAPDTLQGVEGTLRPDGTTEPGFRADHLRMEGVRADALGSTVDAIDLRGLEGSVERVPEGWHVRGLRLGTLTVSNVDWGTTSKRVRTTRPVVLTGLAADLTIHTGGARIDIGRIDIDSISVGGAAPGATADAAPEPPDVPASDAGLIYEDFEMRLRARVISGSLRGIWAEGLTVNLGRTTGVGRNPDLARGGRSGAGVRQFDALRFAGALGESFSGSGTLSSPAGPARDAFGVRFAEDGSLRLDLNDLALTGATVKTPNGTIRIERLGVSATARVRTTEHGREIDIDALHIPTLVLGSVDWRMDDGSVITARGRSELRELRATLGVATDARGVAAVTVTRLHIDQITAEDLRYQSGTVDVHLQRPAPGAPPPLDITNVDVEGVRYERGRGLTAGTVNVESAAAAGRVELDPTTYAWGSLRARTISLAFAPGDRITARAQDVDVDAEFVAGTTTGALSLSHVDTGGIEVSPTQIRIGAGAQPHLRVGPLGRIHLDRLHFANDQVQIDVSAGGPGINLTGIDAAITLDLNPPGTTPRLRRVTVDELNLDLLRGAGLHVSFGRAGATGAVDFTGAGSDIRLEGARVRGLAFDNTTSGWTLAGYDTMHVDLLALDEFGVTLNLATLLASTPGTSAGPTTPISAYRQVMNSIDGDLDFDLVLPVYYLRGTDRYRLDDFQSAFWVRVHFDHGRVDIQRVEHRALGAVIDEMLDFERRGSTLVLELDPRRALAILGAGAGAAVGGPVGAGVGGLVGGGAGLAGGAYLRRDIATWNLDSGETENSASVFTLSQYHLVSSGSGPSPIEFDLPNLHAHFLESTRLDLVNDTPLRIPVGSLGTITLQPMALHNLRLAGDIPGPIPFVVSLDSLGVESVDLNLSQWGLGQLTSATLLVQGVTDGTVTFPTRPAAAGASAADLFTPTRFAGNVEHVRWGGLEFTGTPALPLPAPAAPTPTPGAPGRRTP